MSRGFPDGLTYRNPLLSPTKTVRGGYRGVNILASGKTVAAARPRWEEILDLVNTLLDGATSSPSLSDYRSTMRVSVELAGSFPTLAITKRSQLSERSGSSRPVDPFDPSRIDLDHALPTGYPPFDEEYVVSSGDPSFLRAVMRPELARWMAMTHHPACWRKIVFLESRVWALSQERRFDAAHVLPLVDYLIELLRYTYPVVRPAPVLGAPSYGGAGT